MSFYTHTDKQSGDGLAITNWNDLSSAVAGNSGLTLALNPADKIGIGTTNPQNKLEVSTSGDQDGIVIRRSSVNNSGGLYFTYGTNSDMEAGIQADRDLGESNNGGLQLMAANGRPIQFYVKGSQSGTLLTQTEEAMRVASNGNIGIGTASPSQKLQVSGNVQATKFIGDGSGLTNLPVSSTWNQNGTAISYSSGNVGIGTTSPNLPLTIQGSGTNSELISFKNSSGANKYHWNLKSGGFNISETGVGDGRLFIQAGGNIGIGTETPSGKLHVEGGQLFVNNAETNAGKLRVGAAWAMPGLFAEGSKNLILGVFAGKRVYLGCDTNDAYVEGGTGNAYFKGDVKINGALYVSSVPYGDYKNAQWNDYTGQFYQDNSSRRSKRNIKALTDDFYAILQAEPKTYTRPGAAKRWELGYIAEEFEELGLKKLVYYDREGKPDGINYAKICMYLLEIVKDHEQKIETLLSGKKQD